jgi:hypothetical protein
MRGLASRWLVVSFAVVAGAALASPLLAADDERFPPSLLERVQALGSVELMTMPGIDLDRVLAEDAKREESGLPPRFAIPLPASLDPAHRGTWETLADGSMLWRLRLASAQALSLNLGFTRFHLPPTAVLWLASPDYVQLVGPFTDRDNDAHRQLWTPVVLGEEVVVELRIEPRFLPYLELEIGSVNHGYTGFGYPRGEKSGSCNLDVVCSAVDGYPQVDAWRDQIRSVAVISTGGSTFCTGFLVNNTAQDLKGYFQTANHCGINSGNAASLVTYWNYENSTCRPPGSPASGGAGDGSMSQFNTGSTFRASSASSDFTLVELDDPPLPAADTYWAGWNRVAGDFASAVGIHHPNTDEKRISFEDHATQTTSYMGTTTPGDGTHLRIVDWDVGTTEGGSSGSPVFDPNRRVVGQLHGGYAACGNDESDWYGRVSTSWAGGGTNATRLSNWLDPGATGATTLDGRNQCWPPTFDFTISPNPADAGVPVTFDAINVVGTGPFTYAWDFDGNGTTDCATDPCVHTYTAFFNGNVTVTVTDQGESCDAAVSHAMVVNAPGVQWLSTGTPVQVCGDGDVVVEPGEEWSVPVTVNNVGNAAATAANASVSVVGSPSTVQLTQPLVSWGAVAAGGQATASFAFYVDPAFTPCGATVTFDLGTISWTGGSGPGRSGVYVAATGGGSGTQVALLDDFENAATWGGLGNTDPTKWMVSTGPGPHTAGEWQRTNQSPDGQLPPGGSGYFALSDSDAAGSGSTTSTILTSPVVSLAAILSGTVTLEFDPYYRYYTYGGTETADVDVYDGSTWQNAAHWTTSDVNTHQSLDVSSWAHGNAAFRVRFSYQNASYDWWFAVDNVRVSVPVTPVCDNAVECGGLIFRNGFETGTTSAWSSVMP